MYIYFITIIKKCKLFKILTKKGEDDAPPEALIPKYVLQELCSESAKLKTLGAMDSIPSSKIIRLLSILEKNIRDGAKVSPIADPVRKNKNKNVSLLSIMV